MLIVQSDWLRQQRRRDFVVRSVFRDSVATLNLVRQRKLVSVDIGGFIPSTIALLTALTALRLDNFHYAEASYNLGRVYAARGQNDLAAREWRRRRHREYSLARDSQGLSRVRSRHQGRGQ